MEEGLEYSFFKLMYRLQPKPELYITQARERASVRIHLGSKVASSLEWNTLIQIPVISQEEKDIWGFLTLNDWSNLCPVDHNTIGLFFMRQAQPGLGTGLQVSIQL